MGETKGEQARTTRPAPEPGKLVRVRGRPALVESVVAHRVQNNGTTHLATVRYVDEHDYPERDSILWELEPELEVRKTEGWPNVRATAPDDPDHYRAYLDAIRWSSLASMEGFGLADASTPLVSPWSAAVQIEDYQLVPLLRGLSMPRVSLLLADDVGLGKTIQAGLLATELMIRRGIRRILVLTPAALQYQWQQELLDKFHLDFVIMDADEVRRTKLEHGSDANPWGVHSRIITSMDFLKQDPILEDFKANSDRLKEEFGNGRYPWDLLIVDEAHNVAPRRIGDDSQRTRMMRDLAFRFEHRVFLTATPHNGYVESFTGLLELLDPYRFVQKQELTDEDRRHRDLVMVRRLKSQINAASSAPRFPIRELRGVDVTYSPNERALWQALRCYRDDAVRQLGISGHRSNLGQFLFTVLVKRLLSSPYAFAKTWWNHVAGGESVSEEEAERSRTRAEEDSGDDSEQGDRERIALGQVGTWLFRERPSLRDPAEKVSRALKKLGWDEATTQRGAAAGVDILDGKWAAVIAHIGHGLRLNFRDEPPLIGPSDRPSDRRLLLFTEYRDTQELILARLEAAGYRDNSVRALFGGMPAIDRDEIKRLFNNPESRLRILVATDAASEGLNLQKRCSTVAHYDIPWNPMRLEQRNGRVDRHGQPADIVRIYHYNSSEEEDGEFLRMVIRKVDQAREDLGSIEAVLDSAIRAKLVFGRQTKIQEWEAEIDAGARTLPELDVPPLQEEEFLIAQRRFDAASLSYGLSKEGVENLVRWFLTRHHQCSLVQTRNGLEIRGAKGRIRKLLVRHLADTAGNLPTLVFDPEDYMQNVTSGRRVYEPRFGTALLRIGHPIVRAALAHYRRALWNPLDTDLSRWSVQVIPGSEAYLLLDFLVTARNELQEVVSSFVQTRTYHVRPNGVAPAEGTTLEAEGTLSGAAVDYWQQRIGQAIALSEHHLESLLQDVQNEQRVIWTKKLGEGKKAAEIEVVQDFDRQIQNLKRLGPQQRQAEIQHALDQAEDDFRQRSLFPEINEMRRRRVEELRDQLKPENLSVWEKNQGIQAERLEREKRRYVEHVLPRRFALSPALEVTQVGIRAFVPG